MEFDRQKYLETLKTKLKKVYVLKGAVEMLVSGSIKELSPDVLNELSEYLAHEINTINYKIFKEGQKSDKEIF